MNSGLKELSIIVPAYNEELRITPTLLEIVNFFISKQTSFEILVIDDGSTDNTCTIVNQLSLCYPQVRLIHQPINMGKGEAVKVGMLQAVGQLRLFTDADGATPINEYTKLHDMIIQGFDVAIGSRAISSTNTQVKTSFHRKILGRIFNNVINILVLPAIKDTQCGFKLFNSSSANFLFSNQTCKGFGFDVEILYLARKKSIKVAEVPINWYNKPGSKVNLVVDAILMLSFAISLPIIHRKIK
jgi:dolichyl-phosphate beta-glucosyltransferase